MDRVRSAVKESYEQIGEHEYNRINPYKRMLSSIRLQYPNAKVTKCTTSTVVFESLLVPMLTMHYQTS